MSKFHSGIKKEEILGILQNKDAKIHFVGAGGIGMYSLCRLTQSFGYRVTGSDNTESELCRELVAHGCQIILGHSTDNAQCASLVVYTLAVSDDDPELLYAEKEGIPIASRAEYLGAIMTLYKERIGVSGSHGKSTVTAMIHAIFDLAGRAPTTLLGARQKGKEPLSLGERDYMIYESCEYKDSFLRFCPTLAVFTNLEYDHVDYFKSFDALSDSFLRAMENAPTVLVNIDDRNLSRLASKMKRSPISFGESEKADIKGCIQKRGDGLYGLKIVHTGGDFCVDLAIPGRHNAQNALAAASAAITLGIEDSVIKAALESFSGIERRLEVIGNIGEAKVYYDYAHHPTEITCAINTVREIGAGKLCVIFKPHTYSRTAALMRGFADALSLADQVILCEISAIRENKIKGVSSERLAKIIGNRAIVLKDSEVRKYIDTTDFSSFIIMGAANLDEVKRDMIGK